MRNVFESAVQVKINLIFQRKTLRNHSMMQSLVLMTERNPDGTGQPPPLTPLSLQTFTICHSCRSPQPPL